MLGQSRLADMKAAYRLKFADVSEWRRMNHSTSFCAARSVILFSISVASLVLPLRARPMASLTAARSPESCGALASSVVGAFLDRADFRSSAPRFACRCLATEALRWWDVSFASCVFMAGRLARAAASVERKASAPRGVSEGGKE